MHNKIETKPSTKHKVDLWNSQRTGVMQRKAKSNMKSKLTVVLIYFIESNDIWMIKHPHNVNFVVQFLQVLTIDVGSAKSLKCIMTLKSDASCSVSEASMAWLVAVDVEVRVVAVA